MVKCGRVPWDLVIDAKTRHMVSLHGVFPDTGNQMGIPIMNYCHGIDKWEDDRVFNKSPHFNRSPRPFSVEGL